MNILWATTSRGTYLGRSPMMFFGFLFFMLFSSLSVVGQANVTPSYEWLDAVSFGTVTQAETSGLTIAIDTDSQGNVYRLTFGDGVLKYNSEGVFLNKVINSSQLNDPLDIALDSKDNIYVIDYEDQAPFTDNGKIRIFNTLGVQTDIILTTYFRPLGLTLDNEDNIYVVIYNDGSGAESTVGSELRVYNSSKTLIKSFEGTTSHPLLQPYRIGVDSQKNIYISHTANNGEVVVFDSSYNYLTTLTGIGSPGSIVIDEFDFIHVIDYSNRLDFEQLLNYGELEFIEAFQLYSNIRTGINNKEFGIRIYNKNRVLQSTFFKDHLELPIDLAFYTCGDRLYVDNANITGSTFNPKLEFDLEIYRRTPSFDSEKPVAVTCPGDQTETLTAGSFILPDYRNLATFTDNCDQNLTLVQSPAIGSSITQTTPVTITATDDAGNVSETCTFQVVIEEEVVTPSFNCPNAGAAPDLELDANCNYTAPSYNNLITNLTNFENSPFFIQSENRNGNSLSVNIKVYDGEGGDFVGECDLEVELIDTISPQFTLCNLQDITVELENGESYSVPDFVSQLNATDNCTLNPIVTQSIVAGTPITETTTIRLIATDEVGNVSNNCEVEIIVIEKVLPTFDCPDPNQTTILELNENCNYTVPGYSDRITNFENFDNEPFIIQTEVRNGNVLNISLSVFDGSDGEEAGSCQFLVNLEDQSPPLVTCPNDIFVPYTGSKEYEIEDYYSQLTITDNCSDSFTYTQTPQPGVIISEDTRIEFTIIDDNNNQSGCSFDVIFYEETELQILNCPSAQTFEVDSNCSYLIPNIASSINTNIEGAVVTQNITPGFRVNNSLTLTITAKFEDQTDTCTVDLMAKDSTDPIVICPGDQNEAFDPENGFTIPNYSMQAQTSDNCFIAKIDQTPDIGTQIFEDTQVTIGVEDLSGNYSTCTFTVFLSDENTPNTPPVADDDTYSIDQDTSLSVGTPGVLGNDTDDDADTLTAIIQDQPSHGSVVLSSDGSFTYTPDSGYFGEDIFTYVANDGTENSNLATVIITVKDTSLPNSVPIASDNNYSTDLEVVLQVSVPGVLGNDSDPDNDNLMAIIQREPVNGIVVLNSDGSFSYTPNPFFTGEDNFTYVANDGSQDSNVALVTITVNPRTNSAPISIDDIYSTVQDVTLTVLASSGVLSNDSDEDGDSLTAVLITDVSSGTLTLNPDGSFIYVPNSGFSGNDFFTYSANDGSLNSVVSTARIEVVAVSGNTVTCKESVTLELDENGTGFLNAEDLFTTRPADLEFSISQEIFTCEDLGENTITLSYSNSDVQGSCEVIIIVKDVSAPMLRVKDISVALNQFGSANITPEMLDNGSSDNCEDLIFSLSKLNFGCKELGENTVTFTATDTSGNSTSMTATVTITGSCEIQPTAEVEYIFIYPNPTTGPFQFATPDGVAIQRVEAFDNRGRMIMYKEFSAAELQYAMDLSGVQDSVYILKLFTSDGTSIVRVIIN